MSVILPLPLIGITLGRFPNTETVLFALSPLTLEHFAIVPGKFALAVAFAVHELSGVDSVSVFLAAFGFHVHVVLSLENLFLGDCDTLAVFLVVGYLAEVDFAVGWDDVKIWLFY